MRVGSGRSWAGEAGQVSARGWVVRPVGTVQDGRQRSTSSPVEDIMFCTKSRKEQLQETSASLAGTAATVADQLRERVVPAVGQAAGSAIEWSQPRVEAARSWARPRVEHGIEVAAPKLESAVSGLAPRVDTARDKIVDELLPRIAEAITAW